MRINFKARSLYVHWRYSNPKMKKGVVIGSPRTCTCIISENNEILAEGKVTRHVNDVPCRKYARKASLTLALSLAFPSVSLDKEGTEKNFEELIVTNRENKILRSSIWIAFKATLPNENKKLIKRIIKNPKLLQELQAYVASLVGPTQPVKAGPVIEWNVSE